MPELEPTSIAWIVGLTTGLLLWFVFVSPRLLLRLSRGLHHKAGDDEVKLNLMDKVSLYIASIAMFITGFIVSIMFYEVVMRYFFKAPTLWVEELSRWLGGVTFLLAGLYAMQQRSHIRVVLLYDAVSRPIQRIFDLLSTICIVVFCAAVLWGYSHVALQKFQTWELYGSAWNPPIPATMKPLICIAVLLLAMQAISNLLMDWHKDKAAPHDPADDL